MNYIVFPLLILNNSFALANYFKKKVFNLFPLLLTSIILIIFLSGLFKNFSIGFYLIMIVSIIMFAYNCFYIYKNGKKSFKCISIVDVIIFLLFLLYSCYLNDNRMFTVWDEFSHWGLVIKNMFITNNFSIYEPTTLMGKAYLSGTSMFQYFGLKFAGFFNEGYSIYVFNIMYFMLIAPIIKKVAKDKLVTTIIFTILLMFLSFSINDIAFTSLYVDNILGIAFASSLFYYYLNRKSNLNSTDKLYIISYFLILVFIKDFGLLLAGLYGLLILIDQLFIINKYKFNFKKNVKTFLNVLYLSLPALIVKLIWIIVLNVNNIGDGNRTTSLAKSLLNFLLFKYNDVTINIIKKYVMNIISESYLPAFKYLSVSIVLITAIIFVYGLFWINKDKTNKKDKKFILISIICILIIYAFVLLLCYCSIFGEYEGLYLASHKRYLSTILISILIPLISINFIEKSDKRKCIVSILLILFLSAGMPMTYLSNNISESQNKIEKSIVKRSGYKKVSIDVKKYITKDDKVFFLSMADDGYNYMVFKYEVTPLYLINYEHSYYGLGEKRGHNDVWTQNIDSQEFVKILKDNNYTHVVLYYFDDIFVEEFGSIFEINSYDYINSSKLFKIVYENERTFLKKVDYVMLQLM